MISVEDFGEAYSKVTIENKNRLRISVTELGATVLSLLLPDREGAFADVVLGYDSPEEYLTNDGYLGATVGRYANRISGAGFTLGEREYHLTANEGENTLHGGTGFNRRRFFAECVGDDTVVFSLTDEDGADGFPGNLRVQVSYTLTDGDELVLAYTAVSDKDTVLSMCSHSYFNLRGEGRIHDHELMINADRYTPVDGKLIPTGELRPVAGTSMDFRIMRKVGTENYDINLALNGDGACAELYEPISGRFMSITTDMPGVQLYTAGFLSERKGKNGARYDAGSGLCLETQFFPDSPNRPEFPSCVLEKNRIFVKKTL